MNRTTLVGRLVADVEVRKTQSGLSVASFTVAVNDDRDKEKTYFINCVAWRQGADFLGQYSRKGDLVSVDGKLTTRSYERDGQKVYITEVVVDAVNILAHAQGTKSEQKPMPKKEEPQKAQEWGSPVDIDPDDLPF